MQFRFMPHRALRRFHQQPAQKGIALLADVSEPLPTTAAGMFRGNQPKITGHCFASLKPLHGADRQHERQCRDRSHALDASSICVPSAVSEPARSPRGLVRRWRLPVDPASTSNSVSAGWTHGSNGKASNSWRPVAIPQLPLSLHALIERDRLQLILHLRADAHQPMTMQQQTAAHLARRRGHPDLSESDLPPIVSISAAHPPIGLLACDRYWRGILAASPIHTCAQFDQLPSNHCDCPLASIPKPAPALAARRRSSAPAASPSPS